MTQPAEAQSASEIFGSNRMWGLKEAPLPEPVSWMPQTIGWVFVLVAVVLVLVWYGRKRWLQYKANQYRRDGAAALQAMERDPRRAGDLPRLLRAAALAGGSREEVAGLRGAAWTGWLNERAGSDLFDDRSANVLDVLAYSPDGPEAVEPAELNRLIAASQVWMRTHHAAV